MPEPAEKLYRTSLNQAKKTRRNVFIRFSASWCGWCHLMEKNLDDPAVKPLWDRAFVTLTLDTLESGPKKSLENPGAEEFMGKLGGANAGLPFFAVLDKNGKKLADANLMPGGKNVGCPAAPEELTLFAEFLKKTTPKLTDAERETIIGVFKKNAPKQG